MKDLALPPPGTEEPEAKPSEQRVRLGEKPVLPPPKKELTPDAVQQANAAGSAVPPVEKPLITEAPPPDLRVEREAQLPRPEPMRKEKTRTKTGKLKKGGSAKKRHAPAVFDDEEVAVVARDPRRPREE
jgi:hypothetical protein